MLNVKQRENGLLVKHVSEESKFHKRKQEENTENKFQKIVNYKCFKIKKMSLFFSKLNFCYIY